MFFEPRGLATGIGSVPYTDPTRAWLLVKKYFPEIPHWPQLPLRGRQEHFVNQSLKLLVKTGLLIDDGNKIYFDTTRPDWADSLTEFYSVYLACEEGDREALNEFALRQDAAAGFYIFMDEIEKGNEGFSFLKGQVVGPLTVSLQAKDERGHFAYYNEQLRDLIVKTLAMNAAWQADAMKRFGRPVLIFIDDPALGVFGQSGYITITRDMIKEDLKTIIEAIHKAGGLAGVHSCDAIDWSILFELDLEVVSFDAYNYFSSIVPFAAHLREFLNRGGALAWGLVPTLNDRALDEDMNSLLKILDGEWAELLERGISRDILVSRCLFTPACGTGLLDPAIAERIYSLTALLSKCFREREGLK